MMLAGRTALSVEMSTSRSTPYLIAVSTTLLRAQHIVRDRFLDIHFHQRDMLVRRRMKDDLRLMLLEDLLQAAQRRAHPQ